MTLELHRRFTQRSAAILPWTWGLFRVGALSGFTLFASKAQTYCETGPFQIKIALMAGAFVNLLVVHLMRDVLAYTA